MSNKIVIPTGLREAQTLDEIGIHDIPEGVGAGPEQSFDIKDRTLFMLLDEDRRVYAAAMSAGWIAATPHATTCEVA